MSSEIRDINLAESGERKIEWVKRNCDLLRTLEKEFSETKPFEGKKIALSVHLEAKTAYLCKVLKAGGGADVCDRFQPPFHAGRCGGSFGKGWAGSTCMV